MSPQALPSDSPHDAGVAPSDDAAPRRRFVSRLLGARGMWALGDQAVCSAGNFLAGLLMARGLEKEPHAFGVYSLALSVLLFLNSLHGAIVTYPMTLEGAGAPNRRFRQLVRRGIQFSVGIGPILTIVIVVAALQLGRLTLIPWAILAMVIWQAQETVRRALLTKLRYREAIPGDTIRFLGQALAIYLMYRWDMLSPEWAMISIAITSALAFLVQWAQVWWLTSDDDAPASPPSAGPTLVAEAMHWWRAGRWLLVTCVVNVGTIYLAPWFLEAVQGEQEVARLAALNALLNLTNPVLFSFAGLIVASVAAARASAPSPLAGVVAARRVAIHYSVLGLALVAPYYALVTIFPEFMLSLFFKPTSPYVALAGEVKWVTLIYAASFVATMAISLLNGLGEARASFVATVASSLATVAISVPLILKFGLHGALIGGAIPMFLQFGIAVWMFRRHMRRASPVAAVNTSSANAEVVTANDDGSVVFTGRAQ